MSNDTDTSLSSGSSTEGNRKNISKTKKPKRKSEKKHKKLKREKKEKHHKHKKRSRRDNSASESESTIVLPIAPSRSIEENAAPSDVDTFGPALPPHLLQTKTDQKPIIGPTIPNDLRKNLELKPQEITQDVVGSVTSSDEEDINSGTYGPIPVPSGANAEMQMSVTQIELEQRALQLKLAAIDGSDSKVDQTVREEWMLELPEVGLKSGLAALSNLKRTFHQGKERPDFSDRSMWTKTPQDAENPQATSTSKSKAATLKDDAQAMYQRKRDEEQERIAKKHTKKHKRDESLVAIHQKKLRKEQKKREKELAASGEKPERRPFSRDVDLKLNKIDKNQTKQIVDKAKILNTKFSSGHTKYL